MCKTEAGRQMFSRAADIVFESQSAAADALTNYAAHCFLRGRKDWSAWFKDELASLCQDWCEMADAV
jgi:hypothetical protein